MLASISLLRCALKLIITIGCVRYVTGNLPLTFVQNIDLTVISENTPIGTSVNQLIASDPENSPITYAIEGTDILKVDEKTGIVTVAKLIDREKIGDSIKFWVIAYESVASGSQEDSRLRVPVTALILDVNDSPPIINVGNNLSVSLKEDTPIGTQIVSEIIVTDQDVVGSILQVNCIDECLKEFRVETFKEPTTNELVFSIFLAKPIEYFIDKEKYVINLVCSDGQHRSPLRVQITVKNVQNKPPVFLSSSSAIISEDAPIGSLVLHVRAVDGDLVQFVRSNIYSGRNKLGRSVVYELLTNPDDYFHLDSNNGELRVANRMDKEAFPLTNGVLNLQIRATEVVNNTTIITDKDSSITEIVVTLLDVNDEPPSFNYKAYSVDIDENVSNGTPLSSLDMTIEDKDSQSNSTFNITLIDSSGYFSVEPTTATGSTKVAIKIKNGPLDYENVNHRKFILMVVATETSTREKFSSTATVTVEVNDVNDNSPKFEQETYIASVLESASPGTILTTIRAYDKDVNNIITYSLSGNGAELFFVNPTSGVVTVNHCSTPGRGNCLDYETRTNYLLSFRANDGNGLSSVVSLIIKVIDANDNPPIFTRELYTTSITEFFTKFESPFKVQATDLDESSVISYSIVFGNGEDLFSIDSRTGEFKVNRAIQSKYENITLTVQASDGKEMAIAKVKIIIKDTNDHDPKFVKDSYYTTISETLSKGSIVEQVVAEDLDKRENARVSYKIQKGSFDDFDIEKNTGIVRVGMNSELDYDKKNLYELQILAIDHGIPARTGTTSLKITLLNYNNKSPYFNPVNQYAEVNEVENVNTKVAILQAKDPDTNDTESLRFSIESATAIDKDGNVVDVSSERRFMDFFGIDIQSGEIFVASKIDREIAAVVKLNVSVKDISVSLNQIGFGSLWITILQYNKFPPTFSRPWTKERPELTYFITENQPIGSVLTDLNATDIDSNVTHYEIVPDNEYFIIDRESGVIIVNRHIDYEKLEQSGRGLLTFNAIAYDSGTPQLSCVANIMVNVINLNEAVPKFNQTFYATKINENTKWNTLILQVNATDSDAGKLGQIVYSLLNGEGNFVMDQLSGELRVANGAVLDREKGPNSYTLQIVASDGGTDQDQKSTSIPVYISILDVNDCSPQFNQSSYNASVFDFIDHSPTPIVQLSATDQDEGLNGKVTYEIVAGNLNEVFDIDDRSGMIYAIKSPMSVNFDMKEYKLKVKASDNGLEPNYVHVDVFLEIIEMNRNKPQFVMPSGDMIEVEENLPSGIRVAKVEATDRDSGQNGVISYSFKIGEDNVQENEFFKINRESGEIFSKVVFDREVKSEYQVTLSAQDDGTPQKLETLQRIIISIKDIDDNLPQFEQREPYVFKIDENLPRGTLIGKLKAVDFDQIYIPMFYYIIDGNHNDFYIEKLTGYLYANTSFDREKKDSYEIVIKVTNDPDLLIEKDRTIDGNLNVRERSFHADDNSLALVHIIINDLNDHSPYFEKNIYRASLNYKSSIGDAVTRIKAIDEDSHLYSNLIYNLAMIDLYRKSSSTPVRPIPTPFNLTNEGLIETTQLMTQYPIDSRFVLSIEAREKVPPHRTTHTKVHIWLNDVNKLTRMTIKLDPETVHTKRDEIENLLSEAAEQIAIISDIKYHMDHKTGIIAKDCSDIFVQFVTSDKTSETINPTRIIEILDSSAKLHHQNHLIIKKIALASSSLIPFKADELDVPSLVFIALCALLIVGFIAFIASCLCLKSWYTIKLIEESVKQTAKKMNSPHNDMIMSSSYPNDEIISLHGSSRMTHGNERSNIDTAQKRQQQPSIDNPLWGDRNSKIYEEQELSMRLSNGMSQEQANAECESERTYATLSEGRLRQRNIDTEGLE